MIIILSILLILSVIVILAFYKLTKSLFDKIYSPTAYACKLLLTIRFNQEENSTITDFSRYETDSVISVIENLKQPPDNTAEIIFIERDYAIVYEIEGEYIWRLP